MLKIGKISQLVLILGVFLIIFLTLFIMWRSQSGEQEAMKKDITLARSVLAKPPPARLSDLEARVRAAETELQEAQRVFPKTSQSLEITDNLLGLARQFNLEARALSTSISKKKIDNQDYQVVILEIGLRGQISAMLGFVARLEKEVPTAEISLVSIEKSETVKELDTGRVGLSIYVRP